MQQGQEPRQWLLQSVGDRDALSSIWAEGARARPPRRMWQVLVSRFCVYFLNNVPVSQGVFEFLNEFLVPGS